MHDCLLFLAFLYSDLNNVYVWDLTEVAEPSESLVKNGQDKWQPYVILKYIFT
jgi:hypothetical protein